ncbi:MAG: GntR family transcriptional regulator [Actinomycetia bacterium]|nr:GntR family transcriptional regulator [Actinomycetes bacterium]
MVKTGSKINRELLADQIYETLKSRIISGEYPAGFRLKDRNLAKEFDVSSIPVREALRLLRSQGFVNIYPYKGAEVVDFKNPEYARDIYEARTMIECFSVEKAIENLNSEIIEDLENRLNDIKKACKKKDYENTFIDSAFHREIIKAAGNPYILNIFDGIKFQSPHFDKNSKSQDEVRDAFVNHKRHKRIFDCIIAEDVKKAKQEIRNHLTHFMKAKVLAD